MASKGHRAWRKLFPADFTHETNELSNEEVGVLIRLECQYWTNGGPLPDNDLRLANCARVSREEWPSIKAALSPPFEWRDGLCVHLGLDGELSEAEANYSKRANAGKLGGQANRKQSTSNALAKPNQSEPESESDSSKEEGVVGADKMALYEQEFDRFRDAYPEKVAHQKALAAFVQVREAGVSLEQLLNGVERYKRTKPDKQSFCHPATWLNGKRWTDGDAGQALPDIKSAPPDDPNRRKIHDLLGADNYRAWIETADVRDGEVIIEKAFQRDHVKTHFGDRLAKLGLKITDGLEVPGFLDQR